MRKYFNTPRCLLTIALALTLAAASAAAAPPPLDISSSGVSGGLSASQRSSIETRLKYWADQIADANDPAKVLEAQVGIRADFNLIRESEYQDVFATLAVKVLSPLLTGRISEKDKLRQQKLVNVGLAFSNMSQVTVVPALNMMVAHKNEAVRYLGWRGYLAVRPFVLARNPMDTQKMFDTLEAAAAKETVPPTVGAIFEVCRIATDRGAVIPAETLTMARQRARAILQTNWKTWCLRVLSGDIEANRAFEKGIVTLQTLAPASADKADKLQSLQLLVDLAKHAAEAYDTAQAGGKVFKANSILLLKCEVAITEISQKRLNFITVALTKRGIEDRGAAVSLAILDWVVALKDLGVKDPKIDRPATKPAVTPTVTPTATPTATP